MKAVKLSVFVFVVLVWGMLFVACSRPPEAEKEAAKKAMDAAISAGADKYATPDLEAAQKVWESADSEMKEKKYKEAKEDYIAAKAAFEKAAAAAEEGKKVFSDQTNAVLKDLEGAWRRLSATGKKMEKKLKEKKTAWKADAKVIDEGLRKAKETITASPDEAKAKLDELQAMIGRWENTFKKMARAPQKHKAIKKKKR